MEAEKHERSDLEIQLRTAREMQKQSNAELRNAAEKKEKELQKKIADLGQNRLGLKKQLQQALQEIEAERIASDEAVAAEKKKQGDLLKQYEKEHSKYEVTEHKRAVLEAELAKQQGKLQSARGAY